MLSEVAGSTLQKVRSGKTTNGRQVVVVDASRSLIARTCKSVPETEVV